MRTTKLAKILIVEDEPDLLEFIALFLSHDFPAELIKMKSPLAAIEKINSLKDEIDLIVSDYNMPKVTGAKLFEIARAAIPNVPFIILTNEPKEKLQSILVHPHTCYVTKPFTEEQLNSATRGLLKAEQLGDINYVPLSIDGLALIHKISTPLFKKLENGTFIKVMNADVEFDEISKENYRNQGLDTLYVEKENFQSLIREFKEKTLTQMLFNKLHKMDTQSVKVSSNVVEILTSTVKAFGFDENTEQLIQKNIEMIKCLSENTTEINNLFKWNNAGDKDYSAHHSLLISCLTTAFCREFPFKNPHANEILSLAAFFHDITLDDFVVKNELRFIKAMKLHTSLNKDEIAAVKNHPQAGHDWLLKWPHCPPDLLKIVLCHHELPSGEGFPNGLKAHQIDELSACFIIAEEMVELFLNKKSKGLVLKHMQLLQPEYDKKPYKPFYDIAIKWLKAKNIAL